MSARRPQLGACPAHPSSPPTHPDARGRTGHPCLSRQPARAGAQLCAHVRARWHAARPPRPRWVPTSSRPSPGAWARVFPPLPPERPPGRSRGAAGLSAPCAPRPPPPPAGQGASAAGEAAAWPRRTVIRGGLQDAARPLAGGARPGPARWQHCLAPFSFEPVTPVPGGGLPPLLPGFLLRGSLVGVGV